VRFWERKISEKEIEKRTSVKVKINNEKEFLGTIF